MKVDSGHSNVKRQAVALAKSQGKILRRDTVEGQRVWLLNGKSFATIQEVLSELKKA